MDKKAKALLLLAVALEAIGWGLGMTGIIAPTLGWVFVGLGGLTLVILVVYLFKKDKKQPINRFQLEAASKEIETRINERKQYLPELKLVLNEYINHVEYLANNSDTSILHKEYESIWFKDSLNAKGIKNFALSVISLLYLYNQFIVNGGNLKFREIQDSDKQLNDIKTRMNGINTFVKDRVVRTNVMGYPKAAHLAYSYIIANRFIRQYPNLKDFAKNFFLNRSEKMMNKLRYLQNSTNKRIDELLEGAEDEL